MTPRIVLDVLDDLLEAVVLDAEHHARRTSG